MRGLLAIYQTFQNHVTAKGSQLRAWQPAYDQDDLALKVGNRYLTLRKHAEGEEPMDLSDTIDPFNVLRPHLQSEIHVQDNLVEYWEKRMSTANQP